MSHNMLLPSFLPVMHFLANKNTELASKPQKYRAALQLADWSYCPFAGFAGFILGCSPSTPSQKTFAGSTTGFRCSKQLLPKKFFCEECTFIPYPTKLPVSDSFSKNNAHLASGVHILFWSNPMLCKCMHKNIWLV